MTGSIVHGTGPKHWKSRSNSHSIRVGGYALNAYRAVFNVGFLGWLLALIWL